MRAGQAASTLPLPVIMALCVGCFLIGHYSRPGSQPLPPQQGGPMDVTARSLQMQPGASKIIEGAATKSSSATTTVASSSSSSSSPAELPESGALTQKYLELSGLAKLRPPLKPAESGDNFTTIIPYQILSWHPRIVVLPNFIDKRRCDHVIQLAKDKLNPSGLAYRPGEKADPNQQTRTSSGTFLSRDEDKDGVLGWVEEKISRFTLLPVSHGEHFNVLHYQNEQHYDSHMDTFDPKEFGPQASQRLATVLVYLSDVLEGGETVFKREGKQGNSRPVTNWRSCEDHEFKYKPRLGDAVLFYSLDPDLTINPRALHGGCPVHKGDKWVMTKWIHEKPVRAEVA